MKPFLLRVAFLFLFSLLQFSLLPAALPSLTFVPPVFLSISVAWALFRGFSVMWPWAVVAGFLSDAVTSQPIGAMIIGMLIVLAGFSLVSKRFLYGHPFERIFIFGTAVWFCDIFFHLVTLFLSRPMFSEFFSSSLVLFSFPLLLASWALSLIVFGLTIRSVEAFERYMELFERPSIGRR